MTEPKHSTESKVDAKAGTKPADKADTKPDTKLDTKSVADRAAQLESEGMGPNAAKATAESEAAAQKRADDEAKAVRDARPKVAKGDLAPAGESGDPEVHKLLADRQGLVSNLAEFRPVPVPANDDTANVIEARIKDIDDRLAELGYSAS